MKGLPSLLLAASLLVALPALAHAPAATGAGAVAFPSKPIKDLRPLYGIAISPVAIAVRAESPYKTMADLVAAAKKDKRPLQLGNYSAGYPLVAAWLGSASGLPVTHIPFKGGAQMLSDVVDKLAAAMHKAMSSEAGRAYQATQASNPMMMGRRRLGSSSFASSRASVASPTPPVSSLSDPR